MSCKSLVRRWTTGWVLWAVLLQALAPAVAQAALRMAPALPFEVCSSTGILRAAEPARRVEVEAFRASDAAPLLGQGPITVAAAPGVEAEWKLPVYEAAVVDELAKLGYQTAVSGADGGQIAQIGISHSTSTPSSFRRGSSFCAAAKVPSFVNWRVLIW